jgi:magnesium transporter
MIGDPGNVERRSVFPAVHLQPARRVESPEENHVTEPQEKVQERERLDRVIDLLEAEDNAALRGELVQLHPAETADLLESLPPEERRQLWEVVPEGQEGEIISYLGEEARAAILEEMDHAELVAAAETMEVEDLVEVMEELPEDVTEVLLRSLDEDRRRRVEATLNYDEGTAARVMSTDVISVRKDVTLAVVLRYLRRHPGLPSHTDALMVTADDGTYLGSLPIADVVTGDPDARVEGVMKPMADWVRAEATEHELAVLFERRDLISVAVVNRNNRLLGRITVDDVVDIIRAEADAAMLHHAGLSEEEDLFAPMLPSVKRRTLWLGINLGTVFLASWVIGLFEHTIGRIVALAVLMPVVASMGGIAGSQTLTLTIRGLALDQIASGNIRWLFTKEFAIGLLNGVIWAVVVSLITDAWFHQRGIALIIGAAMIINLLFAAVCGVVIPLVLKRLGIDPALSGAVILTTVTDVVGFMSFLGLATLFLL